MKTITIRINDELESELEKISSSTGESLSDIVREALKKHLLSKRFHELRKIALPYAEKAGFLTDEDVLRKIS